ncbi:hypothetical protein HanPI659440_Chr08g0314011 [Helianthus annuus]|nr:hypothetical protein HanPI659440_Chr08g0314011 [Helianthus annuus]
METSSISVNVVTFLIKSNVQKAANQSQWECGNRSDDGSLDLDGSGNNHHGVNVIVNLANSFLVLS